MSRVIVASQYVWSDYPGLRAGRLWAGKPDLVKYPADEVHAVDDQDAAETRCGLPRAGFPHDFPETTLLGKHSNPCPACDLADHPKVVR